MYERISVKSDRGKICTINVESFSLRIIEEETYLACKLESGLILIPFDNVIEISYDKSKYKSRKKGEKLWREKK